MLFGIIHYISRTLYLKRHEVSKPAYTILQSCQLSLLILELPQSNPENNAKTYFYVLLGFSEAYSQGMIMEL